MSIRELASESSGKVLNARALQVPAKGGVSA